ncbi:MAG: hypothetical protein HY360_08060 [Verrucomicrobia bacterium]|nr:hypothetical protein [Verrucomicrobiota bacterium]
MLPNLHVIVYALISDPMVVLTLQAATLVKDGNPSTAIVIRDSVFKAEAYKPARSQTGTPDGKVKLAATDLQIYIEKMSGAKLPIMSDAQEVNGVVVLVGASKRTAPLHGLQIPSGLTPERNEEDYVIHAKGDTLILAGNDEGPSMGTYYAVAEFLRRQGARCDVIQRNWLSKSS